MAKLLTAQDKVKKPAKQRRIAARVTDDLHALFQRAADLQGRTLTDFIVATLRQEAEKTVETMEIIRLNAEETRRLVDTLAAPPREPNKHQRAAVAEYHRLIQQTG